MRLVNKRKQRGNCLANVGQAQSPFISVVVRWMHVLWNALQSGNLGNRPAILRSNVTGNRASQRSMIAFNSHNASRGDTQIGVAEVPHAHEIGSDESILKADQRIQCDLSTREHALRIVEGREGRSLP